MKKKSKRKLKKKMKIVIIILIIIWVIIGLLLIINKNNNKKTLKDLGYKYSEIEEIEKIVSEDNINYLLNYGYSDILMDMILDDNYKDSNFKMYLEYYDKYQVNIKNIIIWVNEYKDLDIEFSETTLSFLQEKYFIFNNLERYLDYYSNNPQLDHKEIIKRVNSNIDKTFYTDIYSTDTSKDTLIIVNKFYYLDQNFEPNDLVSVENYGRSSVRLSSVAFEAYKKMADAAKNNGLDIYIRSGYRSYTDQQNMYNYYVSNDGVVEADTYSARAGHSEHQTGLAVDLIKGTNGSYDGFKNTEEFEWMKDNAHKYGFILRYTKDNEYITGYIYEPWHYRYVGVDVATYIYENNITYEEYYAYYVK